MSESWQDWDSKDYLMFLKEFYGEQLTLARALVDIFMSKRAWPKEEVFKYSREFTVAVFGKIAPPAVYLKAEYDKWKAKNKKDAIPERRVNQPPMPFDGLDEKFTKVLTFKRADGRKVVEVTQFIQGTGWAIINTHLRNKGFKYIGAKDSHTGKGYWIN